MLKNKDGETLAFLLRNLSDENKLLLLMIAEQLKPPPPPALIHLPLHPNLPA